MTILDRIIEQKHQEVSKAKKRGIPAVELPDPHPRGFKKALLADNGVSIIAEVKRASPSKGLICAEFNPVKIAQDYQQGGAAAVSVLTDEKFFQGSLDFMPLIRQEISLPLLRKDFIIDHFQVEEARAFGADAILLILSVLDQVLFKELMDHAREKGLDCLVEVHDLHEAERALDAGADLIGVNNRNLKDFTVSLDTTFEVRRYIPGEIAMVSESGISTTHDIQRLYEAGVTAALIGEALVKDEERPGLLEKLVQAGRGL